MPAQRIARVVMLVLVVGSPATALQVPLTLTSGAAAENQLTIEGGVQLGILGTLTDQDTTTLEGVIDSEIELQVDSNGVAVTGIRFGGGEISASDFQLSFSVLRASATVDGVGIGADLITPGGGFSPITGGGPGAGVFPTEDHLLRLNQGLVRGAGLAATLDEDLTRDPFELTQAGVAAIEWAPTEAPFGRTQLYRLSISLPIDATEDLSDPSLTAMASVTGTVVAEGLFPVTLPLPGDYNDDGRVNAADYTVWRDAFAAGNRPLSDFVQWKNSYGAASPARLASPEPASVAAILAGVLAGIGYGARRR